MFAAALVAAVVLPQQGRAQTPADTLVYAAGTDVQTLDPHFINELPSSRVVMHIHETLVKQDDNGEIRPLLATSWSTSDDKLTWTFKLRTGVRFQDGTAFDAEAVKYSIDRLRDPAIASPRGSVVAAVQQVNVVDDSTVAIVTKEPFAPLLAQLSAYNLGIVSPTQAKKLGKGYRDAPMGTGPYMLKAWQPGEKITLTRFDQYWGEKPKLANIEVRVVPEDSARVLMLLSSEADVISSVPTVLMKRLESSPAVKILKKTGFRTIYVGLNNGIAPFTDVRVRRAVAHAIDVKSLLAGVLNGNGTLGGGFESPVIGGARKDLQPYPYDPEKARQLLKEAGHPNGFETSFYVPSGRYLMDRQLGEAIQAQLAQVGIKAKIESPEWGAFVAVTDQKKAPIFILGKGSPTGDLDFTLSLSTQSKGRMNAFALSNPEIDKLLAEQRVTVDKEKRYELLSRIQQLIYDDVPLVVLFYEDQIFATRANVKDVLVYPNEFIDFSKASKS
jgi:peptide/nickel transport system substrate-binding protein